MKKIICIILLALSMGTMYYFSSQDGSTSQVQSNKVIEIIDNVRNKVTLKDYRLIKIKDKVKEEVNHYGKSYVARKVAHFSIYACIGFCAMLVGYIFSKKVIFSASMGLILSIGYAIYDENRQLSVNGRSGSVIDVLIDSSGAFVSILILAMIITTFKMLKKLFKSKKG